MSREGLLVALLKSGLSFAKLYKNKSNNAEIEETKKINKLRYKFSRSKITEIRVNFYGNEKFKELEKKNISKKEEKKVKEYREEQEQNKQYLKNLREGLKKQKKYYNYDDREYKVIRDIENLFREVDEDHYKPIKVSGAFNNNYIEYESRGNKAKNYQLKNIFTQLHIFKKLDK